MERGRSLDDLGRTLSWADLAAFIGHAGPGTEMARRTDPLRQYRDVVPDLLLSVLDQLRLLEWRMLRSPEGYEPVPTIELMRRRLDAPTPTPVKNRRAGLSAREELARRQAAYASGDGEVLPPSAPKVTGAHRERSAQIRDELAARRAANE